MLQHAVSWLKFHAEHGNPWCRCKHNLIKSLLVEQSMKKLPAEHAQLGVKGLSLLRFNLCAIYELT